MPVQRSFPQRSSRAGMAARVIFITFRGRNADYGADVQTGSTIMDPRKIDLRTQAHGVRTSSEAVTTELSDEQLSAVSGGKASAVLMKHCATGVHIRQGTITC